MDQRSATRHDARMFIKIRNGTYDQGAMVVDISRTGMGVEMHDTRNMRIGDRVEVHSEKLGFLNGQIRWVRGNRLGILFDMNSNNAAKIAGFFKYYHR
ncbi:PilZ domain-containing protein [Oricola thermophila]|uniref:PilZ domain-containing protein n=2 Tax=Oricola thermophila TaxID=2742145 RepID=A0A6N1VE47_9HYPH|nr:PilZ domain-containing protein [Oricola thermophila]